MARSVIAPVVCGLAVGAILTGYYNSRVTGHPLLFPYMLSQQQYGVPQTLIFQAPVPPPTARQSQDVMDNYRWLRRVHDMSTQLDRAWEFSQEKLVSFWQFYLHPLCAVS